MGNAGWIASRLFQQLEDAGVPYCQWKSVDKLEDGLMGETDLDVLVDRSHSDRLKEVASRLGFCRFLSEGWRSYPAVEDLIAYDQELRRLIHVHVHYQLIMGKSYLKELHLPFEKLYLSSSAKHSGVTVPSPELEFVVWIIRLSLKISLRDRLRSIVRQDSMAQFVEYRAEYEFFRKRVEVERLESLLREPSLRMLPAGLICESIKDLRVMSGLACWRIRHCVQSFSRYRGFQRQLVVMQRAWSRRLDSWEGHGEGKTSKTGGLIVAFVGADGSGKSTLCNAVTKALSNLVSTERIYMGTNPYERGCERLQLFIRLTLWPFRFIRKMLVVLGLGETARRFSVLYETVSDVVTARDKRHRFQQAWAAASNGRIVIVDRYPLFEGYGDGLNPANQIARDSIVASLKRLEAQALEHIRLPDILFMLDVDAGLTRQRKPHETETDAIIRDKCLAFETFKSQHQISLDIHVIPKDMKVEDRVHVVLQQIFSDLSGRRQVSQERTNIRNVCLSEIGSV